jgi:hypothetical protein
VRQIQSVPSRLYDLKHQFGDKGHANKEHPERDFWQSLSRELICESSNPGSARDVAPRHASNCTDERAVYDGQS